MEEYLGVSNFRVSMQARSELMKWHVNESNKLGAAQAVSAKVHMRKALEYGSLTIDGKEQVGVLLHWIFSFFFFFFFFSPYLVGYRGISNLRLNSVCGGGGHNSGFFFF